MNPLKQFISRIWDPQKGIIFAGNKNTKTSYSDIDEFVKAMAQRSAYDTFYTPCLFPKGADSRTAKQGIGGVTKVLFVDVDGVLSTKEASANDLENKYSNREEAKAAIDALLDKGLLPKPTIVCSGNGYHLYWHLTEYISNEEFTFLNRCLIRLIQNEGIILDPVVGKNCNRLLRVPYTYNNKGVDQGKAPVFVDVIQYGVDTDPDFFRKLIERLPSKDLDEIKREAEKDINNAKGIKKKSSKPVGRPKSDAKKNEVLSSLEQCKHVKDFVDNAGDIDEPTWFLLHSNFKEAGIEDLFEDLSKGLDENGNPTCPRWDEERYQLNKERVSSIGAACSKFSGCEGCKFKGHINRPAELVMPSEVGEYINTDDGVFIKKKDGVKKIISQSTEVLAALEIGNSSYYHLRCANRYEGFLERSCMTNPHTFENAINEITPANASYLPEDFKPLNRYIKASGNKLPLIELPDKMGEHDGKYYYCNVVITKDSYERICYNYGKHEPVIAESKEDRKKWSEATEVLNKHPRFAIPLVMALTSPILINDDDWDVRPPFFLLTGKRREGKGKLVNFIQKAFGLKGKLKLSGNSTVSGTVDAIKELTPLPLLLEELHPSEDDKKQQLFMEIVNGIAKTRSERKNSSGQFKSSDTFSWNIVSIGTANYRANDLLGKRSNSAKEGRMFEIDVIGHTIPTEDSIIMDNSPNSGVIVDVIQAYLNYGIEKLRLEIKKESASIGAYYASKGIGLIDFFCHGAAILKVCGKILQEAGLLKIDIDKILDTYFDIAIENMQNNDTDISIKSRVKSLYQDNKKASFYRTVTSEYGKRDNLEPEGFAKNGIYGKAVEGKYLALIRNKRDKFLREMGVTEVDFSGFFNSVDGAEIKVVRIGEATHQCYVFPWEELFEAVETEERFTFDKNNCTFANPNAAFGED